MSYLCYLCLLVYSVVQHMYILCCVIFFLRLLYPMLSVSLDCPFLITPSVFSNVYLKFDPHAASILCEWRFGSMKLF